MLPFKALDDDRDDRDARDDEMPTLDNSTQPESEQDDKWEGDV